MNEDDGDEVQNGDNTLSFTLCKVTREEVERRRTDFIRFQHKDEYLLQQSLTYFKDDILRQLFASLYHNSNADIEAVLEEALTKSGNSSRVLQVVEHIRKYGI
jgi:hypothetical protein